jgi:hypothetical protein
MVYIPGPGSGSTMDRDKTEKKKVKKETIKKREKITKISHSGINKETPDSTDKTHVTGEKKRTTFLPYFLTIIAIVFAFMAYYKMIETENSVTKRMDAMSAKYNGWYQEIKQKSEENSDLLKPNGLINKTLISSNLMNEYIVGIDDILNASQEKDFSKVAFARLFISGSSPVYISIEGNSKTLFAKNMNPGLSDERFYYYKQPQILIEDKTIIIPRNFKITSGNYENTYLLFFNFGDTKLARMDKQKISNVPSQYSIWLPTN